MINTDKVVVNKIQSASYWLGRSSESFDQEDYLGTESNLKFFRNSNNYLLRFKAQNKDSDFIDSINELQITYNELIEALEGLKEVEI